MEEDFSPTEGGSWSVGPYALPRLTRRGGGVVRGLMSYSTPITLQVDLIQGPSLVHYDSLRAFPSRRIYFQ